MNDNLTPRQRAFADYYLESGSTEEAALKAGYSEKYARSQSYKLLAYIGIREYLDNKLSELSAKRIATAEEVLETLTRVMRREEKENTVVVLKTRKSVYDKNGKKKITDTEEARLVEMPTKVCDVNKAAELLGKRYRLFTENIDLSGGVDLRVTFDYGDGDSQSE